VFSLCYQINFIRAAKLTIAAALFISPFINSNNHAQAAGFYIQEQSVKALGSAFAGSVSSLDDASTVYFNPAAMTDLDNAQINAGVHILIPNADLTDTGSTIPFGGAPAGGGDGGNPFDTTPIPNIYAVIPVTDRIAIGVGVNAPFGLGSDYGDRWFGRFDSTQTDLKTVNVQPSAAYKINNTISIGGGVDIQYADAELQSIANPNPVIGEGVSKLEGDDITVGYNVGVLIKPQPQTQIGIHYRSAISHNLEGDISFTANGANPAANFNESGRANLDLPDLLTFGITHEVTPKTRIMGQAIRFGWDNFETIQPVRDSGTPVEEIRQDYKNTWSFAVGGEHDINDTWTLRAGYQYDATPTTDEFRTSRTPDGDRNWFSGGATYSLNDKIDIDVAATYIDVAEGPINVTRNGGLAAVNATTEGDVQILAVGLNYKF